MINLKEVKFVAPKDCEKFVIESKNGSLTIREPFAGDYAEIKELREKYKDNEYYFYMAVALLLAVDWNNKGIPSPTDIMQLDRNAFGDLTSKIMKFQTDIVPDFAKEMIPGLMEKFMKANTDKE